MELPELRCGGGEGEGQDRRPWRCFRQGVALGDPGAAETRRQQERLATPGRSPGLPARRPLRTGGTAPRFRTARADGSVPIGFRRTLHAL
ncbi:hypothetical protein Nmel_005693 [Mimus melanotis]